LSPADAGGGRRLSTKLTLHLGVVVQNYRTPGKSAGAMTTGDVAEILEAKYAVMAAFARVHEKDILDALGESLHGSLESLLMGQRTDPFGAGTQKIDQAFRDFINSREVESVGIAGVPTMAALMGVNHRLKHPYAKSNPRRPSFRDSGTYVSSFRSWMDGGL
jgi:hypothetical protein